MLKNKQLPEGAKHFYKNGEHTAQDCMCGDDLQAICNILEDENCVGNGLIVSNWKCKTI